jgi:hypothetical protein
MFNLQSRLASALATLVAVLLITPLPARAQDNGASVIRTGDFFGVWHGTQVIFSIQQVHANDTFDGVAEVIEGRYKGIKFGFHGKTGKDKSLVVTRHVAGDTQVAQTGPPKTTQEETIWTGDTKGFALNGQSWPFSMTIPSTAERHRQLLQQQIALLKTAIQQDEDFIVKASVGAGIFSTLGEALDAYGKSSDKPGDAFWGRIAKGAGNGVANKAAQDIAAAQARIQANRELLLRYEQELKLASLPKL